MTVNLRVLGAACLVVLSCSTAWADRLDRAVLEQAPTILRQLKEMKCRNVGVLKFLVHKDGEPAPTDSGGTLNLSIAQRLEMALILANENSAGQPAQQVGIIENASAVAATLKGADYRTVVGRRTLFAADYPLAWGSTRVKADAFLTGVARLSSDRKQWRIGIFVTRPGAEQFQPIARITTESDASTLIETGESFRTRGLLDDGTLHTTAEQQEAKVVATSAAVKLGTEPHPAAAADTAVKLGIFYDNQPVVVEVRNGEARIPEPREGQRVHFVLQRQDRGPTTLGVVLKVNGENTIGKQRLRDLECKRWVLEPNDPPGSIAGYQMDGGVMEAFRILSQAESQASELNYGADVGMITMTVYRARSGLETVKLPSDTEEDALALQRGIYPARKPGDLAELKQRLRKPLSDRPIITRGLIGGGETKESAVETVAFEPDPIPVQAVTIRYYTPGAARVALGAPRQSAR